MRKKTIAALIAAAGKGERMQSSTAKQYQPLAQAPMLRQTLRIFTEHAAIDPILVTVPKGDTEKVRQMLAGMAKEIAIEPGGDNRQESVYLGLLALKAKAPDYVLIHDAARPCVSSGLIDDLIAALATAQGAAPMLTISDAVKRSSELLPVERDQLWLSQTPQAFRFEEILQAHEKLRGQSLADDIEVARLCRLQLAMVTGERQNIKITYPEDMLLAQRIWQKPQGEDMKSEDIKGGNMNSKNTICSRSGIGFDVHSLGGPGDHVILCGVKIAHDSSLIGHSDADVGIHAIVDALLGAMAQGDIGRHFPDDDESWRGVASKIFLEKACCILAEYGGSICNLDLTLICERPKITPYATAMQENVAKIAGISPKRVNIKATTCEALGFIGRREGIAALASASILLPADNS